MCPHCVGGGLPRKTRAHGGCSALPLWAERKRLLTPDQGRVSQARRPRHSFLGCAALDLGAAAARGLAPLSLARPLEAGLKQGLGPGEGERADSATCEEAWQEGRMGDRLGGGGRSSGAGGGGKEPRRGLGFSNPVPPYPEPALEVVARVKTCLLNK